ncbi:hypothetical protein MDA_GLEAN10001201 [Myotis davidii]|uniref:Uncharacterized protein n=1 Tax=Myotis davidii TaxID=225400 RepID=L5M008_MYODS|nr:hypothetical protein MDA_GLEAN10001201 [Myotis davidii]
MRYRGNARDGRHLDQTDPGRDYVSQRAPREQVHLYTSLWNPGPSRKVECQRERERERDRNISDERESLIGCLLHAAYGGLSPQPRARALDCNQTQDPSVRRPMLYPLSETSQGKESLKRNLSSTAPVILLETTSPVDNSRRFQI